MTTAHTRRRGPGSNAASELRAVRQAIQGMTTKLLLFPKLRTVWFSCVVVLRLVPVLAGKDPVKVGCSGVGGLARFQNFPGYTWIRRMRVQTESCYTHLILTCTHLPYIRRSQPSPGVTLLNNSPPENFPYPRPPPPPPAILRNHNVSLQGS